MKKLTTAALAIAFTSLAIPLSTASPANAALSDCQAGWFCVWNDQNFSGDMLAPSLIGDAWPNFGTKFFDNITTSGRNNTGSGWCIYEDANYQGVVLAYFPPSTQISRLSPNLNDKASSARTC